MATEMNADGFIKEFKVMNIRRRAYLTGHAHLLGLPQELRDAIYHSVLVEPPLYLREHRMGCPRINSLHGAETPVCKSTLEHFEQGYGPRSDRQKYEACQAICHGRPGLALLRVNKQIHGEAHSIFLQKNLFCFMSFEAFTRTVPDIPEPSRRLVHRLSLVFDQDPPSRFDRSLLSSEEEDAMWSQILCFPALTELSMPASAMVWCLHDSILGLRNLSSLRVSYFRSVGRWPVYPFFASTREEAFMLLERDIETPDCQLRGHDGRSKCFTCWSKFRCQFQDLREMFVDSFRLHNVETLSSKCWHAARRLIANSKITSPQGRPQNLELELEDGAFQRVWLLGLPRLSEDAREDLERAEQLRAKREQATYTWKIRSQPSKESALVLAEADVGEEYPVKHNPPKVVRRRGRSDQKQPDKGKMLRQKENRLWSTAEREGEARKLAENRSLASQQAAKKRQSANMKAERKSSGRR